MSHHSFMKDGVPTLDPQDLAKMKEARIIDVRITDEYVGELGHIPNAELITLGPSLDAFLKEIDLETPIIFVCRSGVRSGKATMLALDLGFKTVFNMDGGMMKWNSLELPVAR